MATIVKMDIVKEYALKTQQTVTQSKSQIEAVLEIVKKHMEKDNKISIKEFGNFYVRKIDKRQRRNPKTGETVNCPATKIVRFKASRNFF